MNIAKRNNARLINSLVKLVGITIAVLAVVDMMAESVYLAAGLAIMFITGAVLMIIPETKNSDEIALLVCAIAVLAALVLGIVFSGIPQDYGI